MTAIASMLVALAAGWLCRRLNAFPEGAAESLNRFVLWICLPALVLARVPGLQLRLELLALALAPWVVAAIAAGVVLLLGRRLNWTRGVIGCLLLLSVHGNTAFLGYPLIETFMGPSFVPLAAVYDQFGTFLLVSSFGLIVLAIHSGGDRPSLATIAAQVVRFPPFLTLLLALALPAALPEFARAICEHLAAPLLPLVAFALGLKLNLKLARNHWLPLSAGLAIKLLLMPLACWLLLAALPVSDDVRTVATLQAGMPPMFTAAALAISVNMEPELSAAMVGYGLVLGVANAYALTWLLGI